MRRLQRLSRPLPWVFGVLMFQRQALATIDTAAASRFFDEEARAAYARGAYGDALEGLLLAHEAAPSAATAFNVAVAANMACEPALGFAFLQTYLALAGSGDAQAEAARTLGAKLEEELALVAIATQPPGASVYVDLVDRGRVAVSPRIVSVEPGARTILVRLPGYEEVRAELVATLGRTVHVTVPLTESRSSLRILGAPPGSTLTLLDAKGQERRPLPADGTVDVRTGQVHLRIECEGHLPFERSLLVTRGSMRDLVVKLAPLPPPVGTLLVSGDLDVRVALDGIEHGVPPLTLQRVPAGTHRVELHSGGRVLQSLEVEVRHDSVTLLPLHLPPPREGP